MITNLLSSPVAASASGIIASMTALVLEYKTINGFDFLLFKDFYIKYIKGRFRDLTVYSNNFQFNSEELKRYADLVIQFESISVVNSVDGVSGSDMNQSLLGLYD